MQAVAPQNHGELCQSPSHCGSDSLVRWDALSLLVMLEPGVMAMVCTSFDLQHSLKERELFDLVNRESLFSGGDLFSQSLGDGPADPGHLEC